MDHNPGCSNDINARLDRIESGLDDEFVRTSLEAAELYAYRRLYPKPPIHLIKEEIHGIQNRIQSVSPRLAALLDEKAEVKEFVPAKKTRKRQPRMNVRPSCQVVQLSVVSEQRKAMADDLISDEFKKWQREQISKNNNPEVTT